MRQRAAQWIQLDLATERGGVKGRWGVEVNSLEKSLLKIAQEKFMRQFLRGLAKIAPIVPSSLFEEAEGCPGISTSSMAARERPKGGE